MSLRQSEAMFSYGFGGLSFEYAHWRQMFHLLDGLLSPKLENSLS
jgi:hypothetical protein